MTLYRKFGQSRVWVLFHQTTVLLFCYTNIPACMWKSIDFIGYKYSLHQRTPLHIAARENYERTAECIIDQGADTNIKDNDGVRDSTIHTTGGRLQYCYILEIHFLNKARCYPLSKAFCRKCFFGMQFAKTGGESLVRFIM